LIAMRERPAPSARASRLTAISIDLVLCTRQGRHLAVLLVRANTQTPGARVRWVLPRAPLAAAESLDEAAAKEAAHACGIRPRWLSQVGAFGAVPRHSLSPALSVVYVAVTPETTTSPPEGGRWFAADDLPPLAADQRAIVVAALGALRERMDHAPLAFRLLPRSFTLGELQEVYELLLGRHLYKASFRRALKAAYLVEPTDTWRSEGRGRPAQLFRFAPRRRRGSHRGVRFDRLCG
jgi:8-oxo-dGTP diphosphatase